MGHFHCKPWDSGRKMEACVWQFSFNCDDKEPLGHKRLLVWGARFHHVPGEPNNRWGKVGVSRNDVDKVNMTMCSHPSLLIRVGSQENRYFVPYSPRPYMTILTDIEKDCLDREHCFSYHRTRDFVLLIQYPYAPEVKKYLSLHHRN